MSRFSFFRQPDPILTPAPIAAVKRIVRLRGCYKVYFKKPGSYFSSSDSCMVAATSPAEAQGIVERAYPGAVVRSCFSESSEDQIEVVAEI